MEITRKDIGYTIYSRLEEALRGWVRELLLREYGDQWPDYVPKGVWGKALERAQLPREEIDDPADLLEEIDIPDLSEIVCYRGNFSKFVASEVFTQKELQDRIATLYKLRCQIAHVKRIFTAIDLDRLLDVAKAFLPILGGSGVELQETIECIRTNPAKVVIHLPSNFLMDDALEIPYLHNLPPSDYDPDGGFVGRREDLRKVRSLVLGDLDRVITISGAGGVGKTALAHRFCVSLLQQRSFPFDAIVWISAKEEKLTLTGIEPIEPTVRNYEEVLDSILEVYGWFDSLGRDLASKEEDVNLILNAGDKGLLLVVDNLETIQDERIIECIKNIPRPNKVLITSRMGLGEVERRYTLKELSRADAIALIRTVAREKGAEALVRLPDDVLYKYAQKMSGYPLAIKWVIGQVALGKDIDRLVDSLASTSGDIAKFCFEHIYENLLSNDAKTVLLCLAASDGPLTRGVLTHASGLQTEQLDKALRDLSLASLVIPQQQRGKDDTIITSYSLLPLTLGYLRAKAQSRLETWQTIRDRLEIVSVRLEEATRAGKYYRYALQDLGATTPDEKIAASWALTAYQRYQIGDYTGAVEAFNRAVEIAPNFSRVYRNWAVVESTEGYYERANELMEKATSLSPEDPTLWFVWGNIEKRRGRLEKARRYFQKALSLSPKDGAVLGGLGEVEKRSGNFHKAYQYFQKALATPPELQSYKHKVITCTAIADNLRRWSEVLAKDKQFDAAIEKAKEAYEYASKAKNMAASDKRALDTFRKAALNLGMLLSNAEDIDAALPYFSEAIVDRPRRVKERKLNSVACYHLAQKLLLAGRVDEAKRYYHLGEKTRLRTDRYRELYESLKKELFGKRYAGVLIRIIRNKGYGFIESEDLPGQMIFAHMSYVVPRLSLDEFNNLEGSQVSFTVENTEKGIQARNIRLA